jgi:tetratricopeptide (TPR) repeat protein
MRRVFAILCVIAPVGCQTFDISAPLAPLAPVPDPLLARASDALDAGDHALACRHLEEYVTRHPESKTAPTLHGEVLFKLARYGESRIAFEKAIARLDETADLPILVHCHGRLVELAAIDADDLSERLHRGIALYLLSRDPSLVPSKDEDTDAESVLCKAIFELSAAHAAAPDDARPCWYLHLAWRRLGQDQPAQRWLNECARRAPLSHLTSAERLGLNLRLAERATLRASSD